MTETLGTTSTALYKLINQDLATAQKLESLQYMKAYCLLASTVCLTLVASVNSNTTAVGRSTEGLW